MLIRAVRSLKAQLGMLCQNLRCHTSGLLRPLRLWLVVVVLLTPYVTGCVSTAYGKSKRTETVSPTATTVVTPVATSIATPAARITPQVPAASPDTTIRGGLSLDTVRALFKDDEAGEYSVRSLPELLYKTALHSPLAPDVSTHAGKPEVEGTLLLLPTPTPTPEIVDAVSLTQTVLPAPTAAITDMLALAVPAPKTAPMPNAAATLPTPTSQAVNLAPAVEATPDGTVRTAHVPILMYHYLSAPPPDANIYRQDLSVSPELFAAHLDAMQEAGYTTITLYELVAYLVNGVPLPEKPVIITFDDGYRDTYANAFPLLKSHGMVATFFVITDFMDEERPEYLTWDMAREMLAAGMRIESHGRNHVSLLDKDRDYLVWQALGSMETIQYELGVRPRFVSYPAGEYDRRVADLFASAGYWAGTTTAQGATHSSDALFDLKRVRVRGTTSAEELLRLLSLDW
jgi:peptidoglycan/xylan/chitin deacetylase (PgdA/CDA1 family)